MRRARVLAAVTAAALLLPAAAGGSEEDGAVAPRRAGRGLAPPGKGKARGPEATGATRCAACHMVDGWEKVRFNHDPTGFPLRGAHVTVACGGCHARGFDVAVADSCSGCHRDRHGGEFGVRCEGCHDDRSWRPFFQAEAHRRTNFPLVGKHAFIPCEQCHGNMRDRSFAGAAVACVSCHQAEYLGTAASSIDHTAAGFSRDCQTCHQTWRFWPARLPGHDACFPISSGAHHGIRCAGCHATLVTATVTGACATGTFTCSGCHTHACARTDRQHAEVMGYACADAKCYQCHTLATP